MNQNNTLAKPRSRATPLPHHSGYKLLFSHPDNVMGYLIALGQCRNPDDIRACITRLQRQWAAPENKLIRQTFAIWISRLLRSRFSNDAIPEHQNLEEVNTMLARNLEDWVQDIEDRGIATGERILTADSLEALLERKVHCLPCFQLGVSRVALSRVLHGHGATSPQTSP